jgi:drug/metabolite transporter (DMT)-like permease
MRKALLQLHIAIILWGATAVLGKLIHIDAIVLVWFRIFITVMSLLGMHFFWKKEIEQISKSKLIGLLSVGGFLALHWLCFFASVKYANVAVALICMSATSLFTTLLQSVVLKTKINIVEILLSLLAIVSVVLLFVNEFSLQKGIVYGLVAAMLVAIVPIINKQYLQVVNMPTISFYNMLGGLITISIALPFYNQIEPIVNYIPTLNDWFWLIILSWACTIITYRLSLNSLKQLSAFTQNLLLNLEPIYGIALAAIFLKEYIEYSIYFYIGIAILLCTILLQSMLLKKKKTT